MKYIEEEEEEELWMTQASLSDSWVDRVTLREEIQMKRSRKLISRKQTVFGSVWGED